MARGPKQVASKSGRSRAFVNSSSAPSSGSSVAGFNDESDIPLDDQDLFHKQRDEILLDGNDRDGDDDNGKSKGRISGKSLSLRSHGMEVAEGKMRVKQIDPFS